MRDGFFHYGLRRFVPLRKHIGTVGAVCQLHDRGDDLGQIVHVPCVHNGDPARQKVVPAVKNARAGAVVGDDMENLKQGIRLRAYGQKDPVVEYRFEGFDMFDQMIDAIRENTAKLCLSAPKKIAEIQKRQLADVERLRAIRDERIRELQAAKEQAVLQGESSEEIDREIAEEEKENVEEASVVIKREQMANPTSTSGGSENSTSSGTVRKSKKVGRNDPCPCGSGKKYKKCCGKNE